MQLHQQTCRRPPLPAIPWVEGLLVGHTEALPWSLAQPPGGASPERVAFGSVVKAWRLALRDLRHKP